MACIPVYGGRPVSLGWWTASAPCSAPSAPSSPAPACSSSCSSPTSSGARACTRRASRGSLESQFKAKLQGGPATTSTTVNPGDLPPAAADGRVRGPHPDPEDRPRPVHRAGRRAGRPPQGAGPLPGDATARRAGQRRHRRAPHDLRRALQPARRTRRRRRDPRHHAEGQLHLHGGPGPRGQAEPGRGAQPHADADPDAHHLPPEVLGQGAPDRGRQPGPRPEGHGGAHRRRRRPRARRTGRRPGRRLRRRRPGQRPFQGVDDPVGRAHRRRRAGLVAGHPQAPRTGSLRPAASCRSSSRCSSSTPTWSCCCPANF